MSDLSSRVVEVCIFKMIRNEPRYLVLQRSATEPLYPGLWQIVTGMMEGDEPAMQAALREVKEETGLKALRFWVVSYVDIFFSVSNDTVNLSPFFALQVNETDEPKLSHEHQAIRWLEYEDAATLLVWPGQQEGLRIVHEYIVGGLQGGKLTEVNDPSLFERKPV